MTATALLILGSLVTVAVASWFATSFLNRSQRKLSLVGQVPLPPSAPLYPNRPAFTLAQVSERRLAQPADPWWVSGLTKSQAEDCLDWLEANGYPQREVALLGDGFAIRYQ